MQTSGAHQRARMHTWRVQPRCAFVFLVLAPLLQGQREEDSLTNEDERETLKSCSCDCCQVADRLPDEVVTVRAPDGKKATLDFKCIRPSGAGGEATMCPSVCQMGNRPSIILTGKGNVQMDYSRFCRYKCKPAAKTAGSLCLRLNFTETQLSTEPSLNGAGDVPFLAGGDGQADFGNKAEEAQAAGPKKEKAAAEEDKKAEPKQLTWDLRKLISHRYRAEAGAEMTRSTDAGERVRSNQFAVARMSALAKKVSEAIAPADSEIDDQLVTVEGNTTKTEEAAVKADEIMKSASKVAFTLYDDTKKLAITDIKKEAAALAKEEAEVNAERYGWTKPDFWPKVMAIRTADPYMKQMTGAIQRASEYQSYAKSLNGQAKGAQNKAMAMSNQANAMQAQGDKIAAAQSWNEIKGLIGRSKKLEKEAEKFWKIADDTQKTIPEWQNAGYMAATYTEWSYANTFTPPPDFF